MLFLLRKHFWNLRHRNRCMSYQSEWPKPTSQRTRSTRNRWKICGVHVEWLARCRALDDSCARLFSAEASAAKSHRCQQQQQQRRGGGEARREREVWCADGLRVGWKLTATNTINTKWSRLDSHFVVSAASACRPPGPPVRHRGSPDAAPPSPAALGISRAPLRLIDRPTDRASECHALHLPVSAASLPYVVCTADILAKHLLSSASSDHRKAGRSVGGRVAAAAADVSSCRWRCARSNASNSSFMTCSEGKLFERRFTASSCVRQNQVARCTWFVSWTVDVEYCCFCSF